MKQVKVKLILLIMVFAALALPIYSTQLIQTVLLGQQLQQFYIEVIKVIYQFAFIVVIGAIVSWLLSEIRRSQEEDEAKRDLYREFLKDFLQEYNSSKRIRRLLRARALNAEKSMVKVESYNELMGALIDIQLRFEYLKKEVENTDLFSKARNLALHLHSMESCLNDIIEEYENSYIKMSRNGEYPLEDLECLKDFIARPKNSMHFAPMFFEPAERILDTMLKLLTGYVRPSKFRSMFDRVLDSIHKLLAGDAREIEYTENRDALLKNLKDNNDSANRWRAAKVLGHYRFPNVTDSLIEALGDDSGYVRLRAAEALGKIKDIRAKESLMKLIQKESEYYIVQEEAKKSLKKIEEAEMRRKCLCRVPEKSDTGSR